MLTSLFVFASEDGSMLTQVTFLLVLRLLVGSLLAMLVRMIPH
jgi:hypothetical protein